MPEILSVAGFMRPDAKVSLPELREALAKSLADAEAWVRWSNQSMGGTGKFLALDSGHLVVDLIDHEYQAQDEYPTRLDAIAAYVHHEVHRLRESLASAFSMEEMRQRGD